ncbi:hypothetical protein HAP41_0000025155 [Bradyrhizobium barranii subsp. apii]|uniref:Uncharacterized protein n=1 Tax=Bradyrhizobium barranii subsp. apii TaxID=2819348 RepID=A0A8U0FZ48_9BRAD|nr:hypothetical protein [Bradyrhizobium barranii]UPT91829.1 hypothetical protein HAP41_0000025155 [Bradyrhizobium barranii subsp. apii]
MARSLRDALNAKAVQTTHSEALELMRKRSGTRTGIFCRPRLMRRSRVLACRILPSRIVPSTVRSAA